MAKLLASKTTQLENPLNIYKALGTEKEREDDCTGLSVGSLCKQICCSATLEPVYSVRFFYFQEIILYIRTDTWLEDMTALASGRSRAGGATGNQGTAKKSFRPAWGTLSQALTPAPHTNLAKALDLHEKALKGAAFKASTIDPSGLEEPAEMTCMKSV